MGKMKYLDVKKDVLKVIYNDAGVTLGNALVYIVTTSTLDDSSPSN